MVKSEGEFPDEQDSVVGGVGLIGVHKAPPPGPLTVIVTVAVFAGDELSLIVTVTVPAFLPST